MTTTKNGQLGADTVVLGGGTTGAVVAGLLAEHSTRSVLVLEAGPDYGAFGSGRWPHDLLDASALGYSAAWDFDSADTYPERTVSFERARVIGGCSSHNGCAAVWGSRLDYDGWAEQNSGWSTDDLLPLFQDASRRLRVRHYQPSEMTPFHEVCLRTAPRADIPLTDDLNDLDHDEGMAPSPVNIADGVRWNAAFAYLDPVRHQPNLSILDNAVEDRLLIDGDRIHGVTAVRPDGALTIDADHVVIAAGTYGTPAILLRSGVGDPAELRALGITPRVPLPGVGRNLHDHPSAALDFAGTPELERRMAAFATEHWLPEEQTIAKVRSSRCEQGFDLHLYPVGGRDTARPSGWTWHLPVAMMTPRSRGCLTLASADPLAAPLINHRYLSDPAGEDLAVLVEGIQIARRLAASPPLHDLLGAELAPSVGATSERELRAFVEATVAHYYHPVGTCKMGPASNPAAVVDARGRVHGLANAYVADCSIMPTIPRANTNVPAVVVGERVARWLLDR